MTRNARGIARQQGVSENEFFKRFLNESEMSEAIVSM